MAGKRRKVSNPLALAVLACLRQRPMHPYEMAATLRSQGKERSIKLNYGSLYTVVDNLAKHGLIEAIEAVREGRRPERTVYQITGAGLTELEDWLSELLSAPAREYPQFEAALSEISVLRPDRVLELLRNRAQVLEQAIAAERDELARFPWLPRLFLLETEYHLAVQETELTWVRGIVGELEDGTFPAMAEWAHWYDTGELPAEIAVMAEKAVEDQLGAGTDAAAAPGTAGGASREGRR